MADNDARQPRRKRAVSRGIGSIDALGFLSVAVVASVLFIDFCDLLFDCGCRSLWNGAAAGCNIHSEGSRHCPWCEHPVGAAVVYVGVVVAQAAAMLGVPALGLGARIALALAALPVIGGAVGLLQGWFWGYWG